MVLITRPNAAAALGEGWERLLSDSERVTRVHLDGLTTEGVLDLLEATGHGDLGRSVAERLREHTGGNPLHARALTLLRQRYTQYQTMALETRPVIAITPQSITSWGPALSDT